MGDIYHTGDTYAGSVPIDDTQTTATNTWSAQKINNEINELSDTSNAILNDVGAKNLLPNTATSQTVNGVTFTVNSDKSVTVSGTATANIYYHLSWVKNISLEVGKSYVISGCPNGSSDNSYYIYMNVNGETIKVYDEEVSFTFNSYVTDSEVAIKITNGAVISTPITFKPMIRPASIADDTYAPYAMTNRGLTKQIAGLKLKYTRKSYQITTTANSYVSPYGAIGLLDIPQADQDQYGFPVSGAVTSAGYPIAPVLVSDTQLQVCTYSAGTFTVAVRFLKLTYE